VTQVALSWPTADGAGSLSLTPTPPRLYRFSFSGDHLVSGFGGLPSLPDATVSVHSNVPPVKNTPLRVPYHLTITHSRVPPKGCLPQDYSLSSSPTTRSVSATACMLALGPLRVPFEEPIPGMFVGATGRTNTNQRRRATALIYKGGKCGRMVLR